MHPDLGSGHQQKDLEEKQMFQTGTVLEVRRWVKPRAAGSAPAALQFWGSQDVPAPRHCRQLPTAWLRICNPHLPLPGHSC